MSFFQFVRQTQKALLTKLGDAAITIKRKFLLKLPSRSYRKIYPPKV